ncbi:MAG: DUF1287 domain-containing protein [Anaerovoracaceae bacterium]
MNGEKLLNRLEFIDEELIDESYMDGVKRKEITVTRRKRMGVLMLAAVLVFAMCITASAVIENEWEIDIINYLGLSNADTEQLHDGSVLINASDTQEVTNRLTGEKEKVKLEAIWSIGDKRNVFIKIETNIEPGESFNPERDYYIPQVWEYEIKEGKKDRIKTSAGTIESRIEEGKLCFYMAIQDCEDLNKSHVTVKMGDIYLYHDKGVYDDAETAPEEHVYDGEWTLSWTYSYKSHEVKKNINKVIDFDGNKIFVKSVRVTPLEIKLEAYTLSGDMSSENLPEIESIRLNNGFEIKTENVGGGGYGSTAIPGIYHIERYVSAAWLGYTFNPAEVQSITLGETEIDFGGKGEKNSGGRPEDKYEGDIEAYISGNDRDNDGIDDQTDILQSALEYIGTKPKYKSKYYETGYPDDEYGVCTDVVANALKGAGYDLMELVEADIAKNPEAYNIEEPDANIDFRRVQNLKIYFAGNAEELTTDIKDIESWQGGDIVIFDKHIGIISDIRNRNGVPYVIHHNDPFQKNYEEDILEKRNDIVGHFRISGN